MDNFKSTIVEYALLDDNNLKIAYETHKAFNDILRQITINTLSKLKMRLQDKLSSDFILPEVFESGRLTFHIKNKTWPYDISFGLNEFDDNDKACFGIGTADPVIYQLAEFVNLEIQGKVTGFGWWARLIPMYNRWSDSADGLIAVHNSTHFLDYTELHIMKLSTILEQFFKRNNTDSLLTK